MAIFNVVTREYVEDLIDFRSSSTDVKSSNNTITSSQLVIDLNNL